MKHKNKIFAILIIFVTCTLGIFFTYNKIFDLYHYLLDTIEEKTRLNSYLANINKYDFDNSWIQNHYLVSHALGSIDENDYTNSLESFLISYENGNRIFEVDIDLSDDFELVCSHDKEMWKELSKTDDYSFFNFKNKKLLDKYTPLSFDDIVQLLLQYDDIYFITDTKYTDQLNINLQFYQIVNKIKNIDTKLLDRIIPQIYNTEMLESIMNIYKFKSVIFTAYQSNMTLEEIVNFCIKSGINIVTMPDNSFDEKLEKEFKILDIKFAVHTIDSLEKIKEFLSNGCSLIYTNDIYEVDIK